jgi:hypothetical protein
MSIEIYHNPSNFLDIYSKYYNICSDPLGNKILHRTDSNNLHLTLYREWSLNARLIHDFVGLQNKGSDKLNERYVATKPICMTPAEISLAASYNVTDQSCRILWLSSTQICKVFHEYSMVWWVGDSLTRQMTQGLVILLKGDLRYGAILPPESATTFDACNCDGQFSENPRCRRPWSFGGGITKSWTTISDFCEWGLCSTYPSHNQRGDHSQFVFAQNLIEEVEVSCPSSRRPIFIFMQLGHHCHLNLKICSEIIEKHMKHFKASLGKCFDRIRFAFSGTIISSDELVEKYPYQARPFVEKYHIEIIEYLAKHYPMIVPLNFANLSLEVANRTSDGFHPLTDGNLIRAMTVINLMHAMVDQANVSKVTKM